MKTISTSTPLINLTIRNRLFLGFGAICLILIIAVGITISQLKNINNDMTRIDNLRVPTSTESAALAKYIYATLATLRGWMLTEDIDYINQRARIWTEIDQVKSDLNNLSKNWTNPRNVKTWQDFKITLKEFRQAQARIEKIANSPAQYPANEILMNEAVPRGDIMFRKITELIDLEGQMPATANRKRLLGIMADIRGTLGLGLASIRAYLLTGDKAFKDKFDKLWTKNERRFQDLNRSSNLLGPKQRTAFKLFSEARAAFTPLPAKMFAIRTSEKWNMANFLLVTEAAHRAKKLLNALVGTDGKGGMVNNQRELLSIDVADSLSRSEKLTMFLWILLATGLTVSFAIVMIVAGSISKPVDAMTSAMTKLAKGDTSVVVPGLDRQDEIGKMAASVNVFKVNAIERLRLEKEAEETRIAQQEAEKRIESEKKAAEERKREEERRLAEEAEAKRLADRREMAQRFEERVGGVLETVSGAAAELNATSKSMSQHANSMKDESVSAAAATTQAGQNVQLVASAAEEMTVSVQEISGQINNASAASKNALASVDNASERVTKMADSSDKISEIILLINDIAEQTNLLALNATIEAARAGDAGRGFAVVASEVKNLASQTATATDEIRKQITEMQENTSDTVSAVQEIAATIGELDEISTAIAAAVEQQAVAMQEISRNSLEAAKGTETAGANVQNVSQLAEENGNAASGVLNASDDLSQQAASLKVAVDEFLSEFRTG